MSDERGHYRVLSRIGNRAIIQPEHFTTLDAAEAYIEAYQAHIMPTETVEVIADSDPRTYPAWRPNRPRPPEFNHVHPIPEAITVLAPEPR